jgi:hypothetical protein
MSLQSEVERLRTEPRTILLGVLVFGLAFAVGIGARELSDSRTAGAVAWILVLAALAIPSIIRSHPERTTALLVTVGAGTIVSAAIAAVTGAAVIAPAFLVLGALALFYAWKRSQQG